MSRHRRPVAPEVRGARGAGGDGAVGAAGADEPSLGVWLDDSDFPADTDTVLALLVHRGTPARLMRGLAALPWSTTFTDLDECQRRVRGPAPPVVPSPTPPPS